MKRYIEAAVRCEIGRVRKNNEDNLYFCGKTLRQVNAGLTKTRKKKVSSSGSYFAVYDGMGGEACGEVASYLAAQEGKSCLKAAKKQEMPSKELLLQMCEKMNTRVCEATGKIVGRMGSTVVSALFDGDRVWICNLGDSRAFLLHDGILTQISEDHTDERFNLAMGIKRKPRLTQHLGVFDEELQLEPYLAEHTLQAEDRILLCSDGLTDMLFPDEICAIMQQHEDVKACVDQLVETALDRGGKDNTTVILCKVKE